MTIISLFVIYCY